ncbi:XkdQ/YqbQ family protein, partial [Brevibacillus laterosporus]
ETKRLSLNAIGDIRVRAGCFVPVSIQRLGINQPFLVDECTHKFDGTEHTMSVELKVI